MPASPEADFTFKDLDNYDPARAQERYDDNKSATSARHSAGRLLGKPHKTLNKPSLKKLSPRHYEMIARHLRGESHKEIAGFINCTYTTVYVTLKDPLSRQIIEEFYEAHKVDLMGLFPIAIDAVRTGLNSKEVKTRLLAVDRFIKLKESIEDRSEDTTQVNITVVNTAREKLVSAIREKDPSVTLTEQPDGSFQ